MAFQLSKESKSDIEKWTKLCESRLSDLQTHGEVNKPDEARFQEMLKTFQQKGIDLLDETWDKIKSVLSKWFLAFLFVRITLSSLRFVTHLVVETAWVDSLVTEFMVDFLLTKERKTVKNLNIRKNQRERRWLEWPLENKGSSLFVLKLCRLGSDPRDSLSFLLGNSHKPETRNSSWFRDWIEMASRSKRRS